MTSNLSSTLLIDMGWNYAADPILWVCLMTLKGGCQNSPQYDDKNMLGNIGHLFVKCMRQVTKGHLYHLFGVSDYCVIYR